MRPGTFRLVFALLALAPAAALGQAQGQAKAWSFRELLTQSLASHPNVLARRSTAEASQAELEAAEWQRYPTPTVEAAAGDSGGGPNTRFRLQQPLWTGGRISAGIDSARSQKDASDSAVGESQRDLALRVVGGFVEAARQQLREETSRRSVSEHERLLELISRRVAQEVSPPVDRELAQSRLFQTINEQAAAAQGLRSALAQLTQLAGSPVRRVADLASAAARVPADEAQALQMAMEASPTLARIAAEERAAAADVQVRRAALYPSVGVRFERDFGNLSDSRLLLVLEATPGAGLSAGSQVEAARARQRALQLARDSAVRDLRERIAVDWNELTAARERLVVAERARRIAGEVFESFTRQYTAGRKTWVDVLNAVRETAQAELVEIDVRSQVAAAALRLETLSTAANADGGR